MKSYLVALCIFMSIPCFGQDKIDSLVQIGIEYHDNGEYKKAIEIYQEALKIDPKSALVNYEIAYSYMNLEDYENAIKYSDVVINQKKEHLLPAYVMKGSALDNMGQTTESIKLFKEAIAALGDHYLLYYNLGVNYANIQDDKNAEIAFINAILDNPNHASSHLSLAIIEKDQNQRVQSLLSLYYFLLLETTSNRSITAYQLLREQLGGNIQRAKDDPKTINIYLDPQRADSEFSAAEMMIALQEASNTLEENKNKTEEELFIENTKMFFITLGQLKDNDKNKSNIWWDLYIPFFFDLAQSEYMDVFCYFISISSNDNAKKWLIENEDKLTRFGEWIKDK